MYEFLKNLDRRWVFLSMLLAVATIENNNDWNFGAPASTTQNAGTINNNGLQSATVLENTGTLNNAGDWSETNGVLNTNAGDIFNSATGSMFLPRLENQLGGMIVNAGQFEVPVLNAAILGSSNAGEILNSGTFLSFPSAKNPRCRLSGDQNGKRAPSVLGNGRAERESSGRSQSCRWPSEKTLNASVRPSGDTRVNTPAAPSGRLIDRRATCGSLRERLEVMMTRTSATASSSDAIQASR